MAEMAAMMMMLKMKIIMMMILINLDPDVATIFFKFLKVPRKL